MPSGIPGSGGEHGTYGGWNKHRREGTPTCAACRQAAKEYVDRWRIEHPESAARAVRTTNAASRARSAALTMLKRRHPNEYERLYRAVLAEQRKKEEGHI